MRFSLPKTKPGEIIPISKAIMLESSLDLVLLHQPVENGSLYHVFDDIVAESNYYSKAVSLTLRVTPLRVGVTDDTTLSLVSEAYYVVPLEFAETTLILTKLADGTTNESAYICNRLHEYPKLNQIGSCYYKGESCFGRPPEREIFCTYDFTDDQQAKLVRAMHLVSESLCSKLEKFEAAMPEGAGGRVWNIRKSQNRERVEIYTSDNNCGCCGDAFIESGNTTHPIRFTLQPSMIDIGTPLGIACVMIHEIAHQFGVQHNGWMNTGHFMGALWASHKVENVQRSDIVTYFENAMAESGCM